MHDEVPGHDRLEDEVLLALREEARARHRRKCVVRAFVVVEHVADATVVADEGDGVWVVLLNWRRVKAE
jgi:hypothetical protein